MRLSQRVKYLPLSTHVYLYSSLTHSSSYHISNLLQRLFLVLFVNVDVVNSDDVISEGSEELSTSGRPGKSGTSERFSSQFGFLCLSWLFNNQLSNSFIGVTGQIVNVDTVFATSSNPLLVWVQSNLVDGSSSAEASVFFTQVVKIPKSEDWFFTTGSNEGTEGSNGKGVDVFLVSLEGVLQEEVGLPDLKSTVPTNSGEVWVLLDWGVSDAGNPIGVVVLVRGELAISHGVPELVGSVSGGRDNLSVVSREANGMNFLGVSDEGLGGLTGSKIPESEGLVP